MARETSTTVKTFDTFWKAGTDTMANLSRRKFVTRTTAGAAAVGVAIGALGGVTGTSLAIHSAGAESATTLAAPLMVYVTNAAKGEVTFLMGEKEVIRHDPALVAQLSKYVQ